MFKKLVRDISGAASDVSNYFQKGKHEVLFRKIKNSAKDLQPLAESAGRLASNLAPGLAAYNPSLGAAAASVGAGLPRLVGNIRDTAADFQQASANKRQRVNALERPMPADGGNGMFEQ